jgi:hypothetical protein
MANAIDTGNPVETTQFIWNKYGDIDGVRVNQDTPRGRLVFRDTNGRVTLPRTLVEAKKAVFAADWPKPLNPPPYFDGPGLNGTTLYPFNDGSLDLQESGFALDPDAAFLTPWPAAVKEYEVPPLFYDLPVTSGNKALLLDGGTFTYGSGNYTGVSSDYSQNSLVYANYTAGNEGKLTVSGGAAGEVAVGIVVGKDIFGPNTITVKLRGVDALV